jgi:hypothetical protein
VLNYALFHEDVWDSEGIAPRILNLGTRWKCVVSFTPREKSFQCSLHRRLGGPIASLDRVAKRKKSLMAPAGNRTSVVQPVV